MSPLRQPSLLMLSPFISFLHCFHFCCLVRLRFFSFSIDNSLHHLLVVVVKGQKKTGTRLKTNIQREIGNQVLDGVGKFCDSTILRTHHLCVLKLCVNGSNISLNNNWMGLSRTLMTFIQSDKIQITLLLTVVKIERSCFERIFDLLSDLVLNRLILDTRFKLNDEQYLF